MCRTGFNKISRKQNDPMPEALNLPRCSLIRREGRAFTRGARSRFNWTFTGCKQGIQERELRTAFCKCTATLSFVWEWGRVKRWTRSEWSGSYAEHALRRNSTVVYHQEDMEWWRRKKNFTRRTGGYLLMFPHWWLRFDKVDWSIYTSEKTWNVKWRVKRNSL